MAIIDLRRKRQENENDDVMIITWFPWPSSPQTQIKITGDWCVFKFLRRSMDGKNWCVFRVKPPFLNSNGVCGVYSSVSWYFFLLLFIFICVFSFYRQLASGDIAPFSVVQLEVIFNPGKPGNALAEFEISFSDPLSPPVSKMHLCFFSDVLPVCR